MKGQTRFWAHMNPRSGNFDSRLYMTKDRAQGMADKWPSLHAVVELALVEPGTVVLAGPVVELTEKGQVVGYVKAEVVARMAMGQDVGPLTFDRESAS